MIQYIGATTDCTYLCRPFTAFLKWITSLREVEFDIETTVTPHWCTKEIITVQFGNTDTQWVLQWSYLSAEEKAAVKQILESQSWMKLIHNAAFECIVCLFHGIRIRNIFDTMLAEQVRWGGDQTFVGYSLEELCLRRLHIQLDKRYQTLFGDNIITDGKIVYAAQDVAHLTVLKKEIYQECQQYGLEWTIALENESVIAFSEMVFNGMKVDTDWWIGLQAQAEPLVAAAQQKLNEWLLQPEFIMKAYELKYIDSKDRLLLNWASGKQKKAVLEGLLGLPGTTKAFLQRYISDKIVAGEEYPDWLNYFLGGDTGPATEYLLKNHREWLIQNQLMIPANTPTINWNSIDQVLPIIQCVESVLDLSAESLGRTVHPIVADYEDFKDSIKLINSFGEKWLYKNLEPDGYVRTSFNQVLTTGRVSSSKPNMQQIPGKEAVGNRYRNAFIPEPGWKFISSDYISQELIIIAYLSQDPVWLAALAKGQDLHSICAEMVFKARWKEGAEKDCAYYKMVVNSEGVLEPAHQKCNCKKHKHMRSGIKTINFGLAFGMSEFKLSSTLRIKLAEAKQMIVDYFAAFPAIRGLLEYLGDFGVTNGYIQTIWPFYRRRWFPYWKNYIRFIDSHLMKAQYHGGLGEVERASKNMPVQGTAADITKVALCMMYWYIHDEAKCADKVKLRIQVHDQLDCTAIDSFTDEWKQVQTKLMEDAARFIIPSGLLKAETTITERWSK